MPQPRCAFATAIRSASRRLPATQRLAGEYRCVHMFAVVDGDETGCAVPPPPANARLPVGWAPAGLVKTCRHWHQRWHWDRRLATVRTGRGRHHGASPERLWPQLPADGLHIPDGPSRSPRSVWRLTPARSAVSCLLVTALLRNLFVVCRSTNCSSRHHLPVTCIIRPFVDLDGLTGGWMYILQSSGCGHT